MKSFSVAVFAVVALLTASAVQAQTTCSQNCVVEVGKSFGVAWTAPTSTLNLTGYRLYIDGAKVGNDILLSSGTTTLPAVTISTRGTHTLEVRSYNADAETVGIPVINLTAKLPAPGAPRDIILTITATVASDGKIQFQLTGMESTVPQAPSNLRFK